jgi:hypothetical protein
VFIAQKGVDVAENDQVAAKGNVSGCSTRVNAERTEGFTVPSPPQQISHRSCCELAAFELMFRRCSAKEKVSSLRSPEQKQRENANLLWWLIYQLGIEMLKGIVILRVSHPRARAPPRPSLFLPPPSCPGRATRLAPRSRRVTCK